MEMLPLEPSWERKALNRTTFGCREADELYVQQIDWDAWVGEQAEREQGVQRNLRGFCSLVATADEFAWV